VKVSIVYDNEAKEGFISDWGFSCVIESGDWKILFDTGASGKILTHNLQQFGLQKEDIEIIALSHKHWDHIGGLSAVLHPEVAVCLPSSFPLGLKKYVAKNAARVVEVSEPKEIIPGEYNRRSWHTGQGAVIGLRNERRQRHDCGNRLCAPGVGCHFGGSEGFR
jgi:7,8-dihydropterin-6-yl-methyl-4-(beta-D-ribofuranosyl)aminobenzene 5'-phosphate synthase